VEQRKKGVKPPFSRNIVQGKMTLQKPIMSETTGQNSWKQPMQFWGCGGNHMYTDYPKIGDKSRTVHSVQQDVTVEDMGRNVSSIYVMMDNK